MKTRSELIKMARAAIRGEAPKEQKVYIFLQNEDGRWLPDDRNPLGTPDDTTDLIIRVKRHEISDFQQRVQGIWIAPEHRPKQDNRVY